MPQTTPNSEIETSGGGEGYSAAHAAPVWFGSRIEIAGGDSYQQTGDGSNLTTDADTVIVGADTTSNSLTVTLASANAAQGTILIINDEGGNSGTNNITVDTEGSETIDGSASITMTGNNDTLRLYSDGSDWYTW